MSNYVQQSSFFDAWPDFIVFWTYSFDEKKLIFTLNALKTSFFGHIPSMNTLYFQPMGEAELNISGAYLIIHSSLFFYGDAANQSLAEQIAADIALHWNQANGIVQIKRKMLNVRFNITGFFRAELDPETVWYNNNPRFNYFRIEAFAKTDISFVDGLKCNTGYFKLDNLLNNSTTAAHEYGHTLGLGHPSILDIRGKGQPGIMYPRGTICDPAFQYDPNAAPLQPGGTLNPFTRKVLQSDIDNLKLHNLSWTRNGLAIIGDFSGVYHDKHE